eukprot:GHVR01107041.1.p1 GENE.GHVR01107041.1~~GHVR01107041.1.p1  ORF type:complete len:299 (+),score=25.28 GHVR01107041.1:921-1817(+)
MMYSELVEEKISRLNEFKQRDNLNELMNVSDNGNTYLRTQLTEANSNNTALRAELALMEPLRQSNAELTEALESVKTQADGEALSASNEQIDELRQTVKSVETKSERELAQQRNDSEAQITRKIEEITASQQAVAELHQTVKSVETKSERDLADLRNEFDAQIISKNDEVSGFKKQLDLERINYDRAMHEFQEREAKLKKSLTVAESTLKSNPLGEQANVKNAKPYSPDRVLPFEERNENLMLEIAGYKEIKSMDHARILELQSEISTLKQTHIQQASKLKAQIKNLEECMQTRRIWV